MATGNTIGSVYVRVRPRVTHFRRDTENKLKAEFSKPIELPVTSKLEEGSAKKLARDVQDITKRAGDSATIKYHADFHGVDEAIGKLKHQLKELGRDRLKFNADVTGVEDAIRELQRKKFSGIKVDLEYTPDEQGYRNILSQIERVRSAKLEKKIAFTTDEASLAATETWARQRLRQAKLEAPVEFRYVDDAAGRRSLLQHLENIQQQRREIVFDATLNDDELTSKIRALRSEQVAVRARFDLASAAAVEGQLAALARDRWVDLKPRISKRAMATLEGSFLAVAGLNSIGHLVRHIEEIALNFDDMAIAASAAAAGLGSLVSVGTVGLGALLNVAGDTLEVFQGLAMAPALMLSGATAMQTWTAIWQDFEAALTGIPGALEGMPPAAQAAVGAVEELNAAVNQTVQQNFWAEMTDEVERFTETIGPHITRAMGETATVMGRTVSSMLDHTEALARDGSLDTFIQNNTKFMELLGDAADVAFKSLMDMGIQGSRYLPRLGMWINNLSRDFSAFINEATRTGKFDQWIQNSIRSIQSLGRFSKGTWDLLAGIGRAFDNVGGAGLHEMAEGMERIGRWANSSGTQAKLEGIFSAAMDGAANAGRGFADLVKVIWDMDDAINALLRQTGQLAGDFMTQISKIDFTVATRGVTDLLDGMIDFVNRAGPGFESIANIFGRLSSIGGEVAREIAHGLNLTMGAIDGFIARIEGPLIAAIHPLTRVFEDLAAMGGPILFALADSVGVLLQAFAALPGPIQNVITLLAIMGRTGFGTALQKTAGHFTDMRNRVTREMVRLSTQVPGYFDTAAGSVERRAMVMSQRVQARMNTMRTSLRRAFGAGGLLGALGGGWGIAIAGAVAGLSALAGASAEAEAAQKALGDTLDEVTGTMTKQTEVAIFDAMKEEYSKTANFFEGRPLLSESMEKEAQNLGLSVDSIIAEITRSKTSGQEYLDILQQVYDASLERENQGPLAFMDPTKKYDDAGLQQLAKDLGWVGDASIFTRENMGHLQGLITGLEPVVGGLSTELENAYERLATTGDGIRGVEANVQGFPSTIQELSSAFETLGDDAANSADRVDALRTALDRLGGNEELTALQLEVQAEELARSVKQDLETALESTEINFDSLFKGGELNPKDPNAALVLDSMDLMTDEMMMRIEAAEKSMSEAEFDEWLKGVPEMWDQRGRDIAKILGATGDDLDAFMKLWNSQEFNEHDIRFAFKGEEMMDKATQDFIRLKNAGAELTEEEFYATLGFDGEGAVTEAEYMQGLADAFNETYAEAEFGANSEEFETMLDMAIESGLYFDGEEFVAALDADGQPVQAAMDQAEARGYAWDGQDFVAVANVKTDAATDALTESINNAETVWNGKEFISLLDANNQPTKEGLAYAQSLGLAWHNGEFVAIVDANGAHADEEITAMREKALRFEGIYQALLQTNLPPEQVAVVAEAIASNEEFEGDYQAFLEVLQTEDGRKLITDIINGLEGVPEETKAELIALFTGEEEVTDAKEDLEELDGKKAKMQVEVEYPGKPKADEAKTDADEINSKKPLVGVEVEYPGKPTADEAKTDADEIGKKNPVYPIDALFPGKETTDEAKADADELDQKNPSFPIWVDYEGEEEAEKAKTDSDELDGKQAQVSVSVDAAAAQVRVEGLASAMQRLSSLVVQPSVTVSGVESVQSQVQAATSALQRFGASSTTASLTLVGAGVVVSQAQVARAALLQAQGTYLTRLTTTGGPQVVAAARSALAANRQVDDVFTTQLRTVGGPQVIAMATRTFRAASQVDDVYTAVFREVGANVVIGRAYAVQAAINSIDLNPVVTFGGRVSSSLNAAASRVRAAAASARAAAALSADGSLSNSRFKPEIRYFNDGGINFMSKPTRAHIAPAGSYVMYAEKETGGEAFIPLAASKRQRSVAIWKETGKRLNVYEDGDVVGGEESQPRPQTQINVTNHYPQAEPTSRTVNDGLDYAAALGFH